MPPPDPTSKRFHCAICDDAFDTKTELSHHTANHYNNPTNSGLICNKCQWSFDDPLALVAHRSLTGHRPEVSNEHSIEYFDVDKPKDNDSLAILSYDDPPYSSSAPTNANDDKLKCKDCNKQFKSQALYNNHFLACTSVAPLVQTKPATIASSQGLRVTQLKTKPSSLSLSRNQTDTSDPKAQASKPPPRRKPRLKKNKAKQQQQQPQLPLSQPPLHTAPVPSAPSARPAPSAPSAPSAPASKYICNTQGCARAFRSEAGLKQHKKDIHGIGGPKLDLDGRDSWMQGSRKVSKASAPPHPLTALQSNMPLGSHHPAARNYTSATHPAAMQVSINKGNIADIEQGNQIQCHILRLFIQFDIFIRPDVIEIGGISWKRIPVATQDEILRTLDSMCHLPKQLQGEYLPAPTTFKGEYKACYNLSNFTSFASRDPKKPGRGAVVIACCKVALPAGHQEVVKIAAIDFTTGDILMDHLVCTDPHMSVADWRTYTTGLSSWQDLEAARQAGYKVFKGWSATRRALQSYIDRETIIVGHNLRVDLDALRIIHGRAVDIVKVMEKAANGPLDKIKMGLDSLCYDTTTKIPDVHHPHGRDALMDAFAVRELVLWAVSHEKDLQKLAQKRSSVS